jgi:lipopolysaccharide export LptBFGC system permease protein LptF
MKRLHRYLLSELLRSAGLTMVAILAIFFIVALALVLGTSRAEGVPFSVVLRHTGYRAAATLYLTLPLTVLTACIMSYGRARTDGEFTAMGVSGIHPWHVLVPAIFLGAAATLSLAWLQDEVMPGAHFRGRVELEHDVLSNLESVLKRSNRTIEEESWSASWTALRQDEEGHIVLAGLQLLMLDDDRVVQRSVRAAIAKPQLDPAANQLNLELRDVWRTEADGSAPSRAGALSISLNLDSFGAELKSKREGDCSYEELLTEAHRQERLASSAPEATTRERAAKRARKYRAEYHLRVANAFSSVLFAFLGAVLGLWRGTGNRALVFLLGFLIVVGVYYPLNMVGASIANAGVLPPALATWIGNVVLAGLATKIFRKFLRP